MLASALHGCMNAGRSMGAQITYLLTLSSTKLFTPPSSLGDPNVAFDMLSFSCNNVPIPFIHALALVLVFIPFIPNFSAASKMQLIKTSATSSQLRRVSPNLHWSHNVRPTLASAQSQQCLTAIMSSVQRTVENTAHCAKV